MSDNQMRVSPDGEKGRVGKKSNSERASVRGKTKKDTLERARKIAKNQGLELIVQKKDGKIQERDSYGNDPYPPRG